MYCDMPLVFFKSFPDEDDFPWGDYLKVLCEEWFILIDQLAEKEQVLGPKRLFPKYQVEDCYTGNIEHIMQWPYPKIIEVGWEQEAHPKLHQQRLHIEKP